MTRQPTPLDELIKRYRGDARHFLCEAEDGGDPGEARYYSGLTEGLRIARRVLYPADRDTATLARLNGYRDARADIESAVADAVALGWGPSRIARESGLTRMGIAKMLTRIRAACAADET